MTRFGRGLWRLADPKISLASFASMFLGACAASRYGAISPGWLAATVAAVFALEVAKNASGEIYDFDSGADLAVEPQDRTPFSGGKRVLVESLLTRRETAGIAAAGYAAAILLGLAIVRWREPRALWLGIAGIAAAFFYQAPPLKLSYRGFGEAAVALSYGPLLSGGTFLVLRGAVPAWVLWTALALGVLIGGFLWINEFPDARADRVAGKRTLVVRLGPERAASVFSMLVAAAFLLLAAAPLFGAPVGVAGGFAGLPPALSATRRLRRSPRDTPAIVPAQARTLLAFVLMAIGAGVGMVVGP